MPGMRRSLIAFCGLLAATPGAAFAQLVDEAVTARLERYRISGLATRLENAKSFRFGIALFPGHPGTETLVLVLDAPSDQWATFSQDFRATPRYGTDVSALLNEVSRRILTASAWGPTEKGGACQAFTAHGFVGVEPAVAMRSWVRTGAVPGDVSAP